MRQIIFLMVLHVFPWIAWGYDPLASTGTVKTEDLLFLDSVRNREIPLRIYLPEAKSRVPVILFSHGLGGSREGSSYLGRHWAARGYVVVYIQHPGSDEDVWKTLPIAGRFAALQNAANGQNFLLRVGDVHAVIDALERWNAQLGHLLGGRLDLSRIGMSGHSFGAVTTQAVSGQSFPIGNGEATDPRIKAAVAFSPSAPKPGHPETAFAKVKIPWMLMTGTRDVSMIGHADVESRLAVYPALPPGDKYELVLDGAQHLVFTDTQRMGASRHQHHHRSILALTSAFWDAHLKGDRSARDWLDGSGPGTILDPADRWRHK